MREVVKDAARRTPFGQILLGLSGLRRTGLYRGACRVCFNFSNDMSILPALQKEKERHEHEKSNDIFLSPAFQLPPSQWGMLCYPEKEPEWPRG